MVNTIEKWSEFSLKVKTKIQQFNFIIQDGLIKGETTEDNLQCEEERIHKVNINIVVTYFQVTQSYLLRLQYSVNY